MERIELTIYADSLEILLERLDDIKDGRSIEDLYREMKKEQTDEIIDCNQDLKIEIH